ncbi:hypothetical protein BS78_09G146500 [Paspalum vaginatum]|nr:hypothetical protein BS78_09G146500 [Paspalum vaginatum]
MACPWWADNYKELIGWEYRCYVGNLPYGTSESSLQDAFSSYAPLNAQPRRS